MTRQSQFLFHMSKLMIRDTPMFIFLLLFHLWLLVRLLWAWARITITPDALADHYTHHQWLPYHTDHPPQPYHSGHPLSIIIGSRLLEWLLIRCSSFGGIQATEVCLNVGYYCLMCISASSTIWWGGEVDMFESRSGVEVDENVLLGNFWQETQPGVVVWRWMKMWQLWTGDSSLSYIYIDLT